MSDDRATIAFSLACTRDSQFTGHPAGEEIGRCNCYGCTVIGERLEATEEVRLERKTSYPRCTYAGRPRASVGNLETF